MLVLCRRILARLDKLVARAGVLRALALVVADPADRVVRRVELGIADDDDGDLVQILDVLHPVAFLIQDVVTDVDRHEHDDLGRTILARFLADEPEDRECERFDAADGAVAAAARADELRRFLTGDPILARPISRGERLVRWCRKNPRVPLLSAAVLAVVLLAYALAWSWFQGIYESTSRTLTQRALDNVAFTAESVAADGTVTRYWLVDDRRSFRGGLWVEGLYPPGALEPSDVDARLAHLDKLGVDIQVLFPTIFITAIIDRPSQQAAR